jgi:hypothetical protein
LRTSSWAGWLAGCAAKSKSGARIHGVTGGCDQSSAAALTMRCRVPGYFGWMGCIFKCGFGVLLDLGRGWGTGPGGPVFDQDHVGDGKHR